MYLLERIGRNFEISKREITMSWDSLGLISIVLSWVGLLFMIWYWKGDLAKTFSQNAARNNNSIIFYALLWLVCLPILAWFLLVPFYDALELNIVFLVISAIAVLGMLIAALIPETKGWKVKIHRLGAFTMAICFMPLVTLIIFSPVISTIAQIVSVFALMFMIFSAIYSRRNGPNHPKLLIGQALYILAFQFSVIFAYYL